MGVTRAATAPWFLMMVFLWPFGCSMIQPAVHKNIPPPAPVPQTIEQLPEYQPQQASPQEVLPPSPPPPEIKYFTHEIKWSGEDLSSIARWYTGSAKNWMRLVEVNPGIDPKRINIGDSVLIPEDLLTTRKLMPIDFLPSTSNKKKAPPPPAKQVVKSDKITLFGPIDTVTETSSVDNSDSPLPLETIE